jgi:hypothetical protein
MKSTLIYSIKAWLFSVVLCPILYLVVGSIMHPGLFENLGSYLGFAVWSIPFGLVLSAPCWIVLWLVALIIDRRALNLRLQKIILSAAGMALCLVPYYFLIRENDGSVFDDTLSWVTCYCIVILVGVLFYNWTLLRLKAGLFGSLKVKQDA